MMAGSEIMMVLMMLLFGNSSGNEVLDYLDSEYYWSQQGIEMKVENLRGALEKPKAAKGSKAAEVEKLMAIRGLGELKSKEALEVLVKYAESRDLFVSEYANAAIAQIKGEESNKAKSGVSAELAITAFPENTGIVGQMHLVDSPALDIKGMMKEALGGFGAMMPQGDNPDAMVDEMMEGTQTALLAFLHEVGNIRVDTISFGVADAIGDDKGWVAIQVHGAYDQAALSAYISKMLGEDAEVLKSGGVAYFQPEDEVLFAPVSNELFLFLAGASTEQIPHASVAERVLSGEKEAAMSAPLLALVKKTQKKGPVWVSALVTGDMLQVPHLNAYKTLRLETTAKDKKTMELLLVGEAESEEKAETTTEALDELYANFIAESLDEMKDGPELFKPMIAFLESIQFRARGNATMINGTLKEMNVFSLMAGYMMPMSARVDVEPAPEAMDDPEAADSTEASEVEMVE